MSMRGGISSSALLMTVGDGVGVRGGVGPSNSCRISYEEVGESGGMSEVDVSVEPCAVSERVMLLVMRAALI